MSIAILEEEFWWRDYPGVQALFDGLKSVRKDLVHATEAAEGILSPPDDIPTSLCAPPVLFLFAHYLNSAEATPDPDIKDNLFREGDSCDDEDWKSDESAESVIPGAKPEEGMVSLMQHFLNAQQRREERFLLELRGLRESIVEAARPDSDGESPRLELPTPAASRVASQRRAGYHRDSPGVPVLRGPPQRMEPTMPSLQPGDDIENYLRRFERLARTWRWPEEEWSCRLVPLLTGRALEAYLAMDKEQAKVYDELKKALLEKYDISPETYRQRFRSATVPAGESPTETYHRLKNLYERWVRPREHSKEEIGEAIILEQLLRVLPVETRTWVREHEPTAGVAAAKLAQQYLNAHRGTLRTQPPSGTGRTHPGVERRGAMPADSAPGWNPPGGRPKELVCFYCQQTGHKASVCPARKAKLSGYCYVPREGDVKLRRGRESLSACHVTVNGCCLQALLDTGSALSMVQSGFGSNVDYVNTVGVQCVYGDVKRYPQAEVLLEVQGQTYLLMVAVVASLPTDMILGRDLPVLCDLLQSTERSTGNVDSVLPGHLSCPAFTRAQARAGLQPLPDMDESLLQGGDRGPKKSRRLKRLEKYLGTPTSEVAAEHPEGIGWQEPENIAELQKGDVTLKAMFEKAMSDQPSNLCEEKCVVKNDILYVQAGDKSRLVVPASCRPLVLHLAHSVPWAGHLGQQKTFARVSSRFHWPTFRSWLLAPLCAGAAPSGRVPTTSASGPGGPDPATSVPAPGGPAPTTPAVIPGGPAPATPTSVPDGPAPTVSA
ncbi:uncharacterized protein LOC114846931 [Betta splendens]|uniref:Uncharacterized protein LOC114846931 n=1 Tax=Betta splendens TaxID=158456 RepID=A0A8M1H8J8_BETSP|nr:uncharacterized protein LOC114846931 [Betta splendens]